MTSVVSVEYLGLKKFEELDRLQKNMVSEIKGTSRLLIMGAEFESVITLGLRAEVSCDIMSPMQIPFVKTDRGGFATIHSPGQLIIYPMIDLRFYDLGIKQYIDILFKTTEEVLKAYGIESEYDSEKPGLYTSLGKISFVGIKVDQGVVRHGLSLNVHNDLNLFQMIKSCGIRCQSHDKIQNYTSYSGHSKELILKDIFQSWVERFKINLDFISVKA